MSERKRILIVDDDDDLAVALGVRLMANGFDLERAGDAITAVSKAKNTSPDLILLDLGLPAGSGFVVLDRLQKLFIRVPVIVITASGPKNREQAMQAGAVAYIEKPVDATELLATIRKALPDDDNQAG
ncbi:MAG: response regulator [Acidimicrobiia bacterium]